MMRLASILAPGLLLLACNGGGATSTTSETSTGTSTGDPGTSPTTTTNETGATGNTGNTGAGTSSATDGSTATTGGTSGVTTEMLTGTGSTGVTSVDTTTGGTTAGTSSTGSTSSGDTSTGEPGETTGGVMGCDFDGPEVEATLVHVGEPPPPCGTLEFEGTLVGPPGGPSYALDACPCDANCLLPDPWTFAIDVPDGLLPAEMPACPRIVVQRQMSKMGCELVGAAVFATQSPEFPLWVAGSLLGPLDAVKPQIEVVQKVVEECECDGCCSVPQRLDLEFSAFQGTQTIPEGGVGEVGFFDAFYLTHNLQSHLSGICDASPSIDYVMQLQFLP